MLSCLAVIPAVREGGVTGAVSCGATWPNAPSRPLSRLPAALEAAGMHGAAAAGKGTLFARACRGLESLAADGPAKAGPYLSAAFFVPGRLEVLGKHTDYAGGRSLLCTVERGICLVAIPRDDDGIRIVDAADGSTVTCRLDPNLPASAG